MSLREQIGVPEGSLMVEVDAVRMAVSREGKGPPVVCLHATGHGSRDYEGLAAALKDRFEVIRVDWPGQGRSGADRQPARPSRYAELLHGLLTQLRIKDPIVIGNSIGGAAAIHYASKHPTRGVVLCNPGGLVEVTETVRKACALFARWFAAGARGASWFKVTFSLYYRLLVLPSPAAVAQRQRIVAAACETAPAMSSAWSGFGERDADIRMLARALKVPVWFAWAKRDRIVSLSSALPAIRAIPHAALTTFDAGHAAFLEQPDAFVRGFLDFSAQLP